MKKLLIILTFLFSTIFFIDNASAKTYEFDTDLFGTVTVDIDTLISGQDLTGNFILSKNSAETNLVLIFESNDETLWFTGRFTNMSGSRYINTYYSNYNSTTGTWSSIQSSSTYGITTNYRNIYYTNIDTIPVYNTNINMKYDENTGIYFESNDTSRGDLLCVGTSGGGYLAYKNENTKLIEFYYNNSKSYSFSYETYPYYFVSSNNANYCEFDYSAEEFYYNTATEYITANTTSYSIRPQSNSSINSNSQITQYPITYSSFDIYDENGDLYYSSSPQIIPTVLISKSDETTVTIDNETFISSVSLNIVFSVVDNEKYLYMYKYGIDSDWTTVTLTQSNSLTRTYNYNDTLYVQVLDIETQEVVSSATYTVNSINYNFKPYVDVVETVPTSCFFYKNGQNYTICKNLNIIAKNLEDGNFIASYSYNATDWTNFENTNLTINENTTVYFRITNYLTNEISYTFTYTVSSIDSDISDLGVFNTYSSYYDKYTSFITAYINIYNLLEPVQDNYKIYYSTNSTSFTDITLLLNDMTNYYQYEINNINENKTIYFKITDLNENILYTSTYSINYQIQANENTNFFTNFRTNFHGLSDIISTPLYAIKKLNKGVCTPLEIPIPYTNKTISLPCMTTVYQNNIPSILNIWQIVTNGIISYYIILDLFRIVKSFKEPEEDKIEVVDL